MTKILMVVVLPEDDKEEVFAVLSHMQGKHPKVALSKTIAGSSALVELSGRDSLAQDAAAEVKRGLKINNCRIWHEQVMRGCNV